MTEKDDNKLPIGSSIHSGTRRIARVVEESDILREYFEQPHQAILKLLTKPAIQTLRDHTGEHLNGPNAGIGQVVDLMHPIVRRWAHECYQDHISKSFSADNMRDFVGRKRKSNLVIPARLFVHCYIWITTPAYRNAWGPFDPMDDDPTGAVPPGNSPISPPIISG
ncbi:MAG: hypothetical protein AAFW83_12710 [Pseudomonadota bacterium]